jgi:hypothetical protein
MLLLEAYAAAVAAWQADPGISGQLTSRQIELLGRAAIAERELREFEERIEAIRQLRADLRLLAADPMRRRGTS